MPGIPIVAGAYDAPDRRFRRGCVHPLDGVFSLTVLGLMYGGQSLSAIYWFGDTQPQLLSWSGLRRSPSVQTLSRLRGIVSVDKVRRVLLEDVYAHHSRPAPPIISDQIGSNSLKIGIPRCFPRRRSDPSNRRLLRSAAPGAILVTGLVSTATDTMPSKT